MFPVKSRSILWLSVVASWLLPMNLLAEGETESDTAVSEQAVLADSSDAVRIKADKVEFDRATGGSIYSGNVTLTQGRLSLMADAIEVTTVEKRLASISATGKPATFRSVLDDGRPVKGEAWKVDYDSRREELVLIGKGKLLQGGNSIENDRIVYNLRTDNLKAGGKGSSGQVEVILLPAE